MFYVFFYSSFGIAPKEGLENFNRSAEFFGQPRGVGVGGRTALGEPPSWVVRQSGTAALSAA